jgi:hypothetical protein
MNLLLLLLILPSRASAQTTLHYSDMTPNQKIITAAKEGNINGIREAIVSGADVNVKSIDYGMTALHYVANGGYGDIATMLIDMGGANMNLKDNDHQTPLMLAATRVASVTVAEVLISKGAEIDETDNEAMTALMWATTHRNEKVARALLRAKANQNLVALDGQSALQKSEQRRSDGPFGDAIENMLKYDSCQYGDGKVQNALKKNVMFLTPAVGYMQKERFDVTTCVCGLNLCDSGNNQPHPRLGMFCNNLTSWCSMTPVPDCSITDGSGRNPGGKCACGYTNCCQTADSPYCKQATGMYCHKERSTCKDNKLFFGFVADGRIINNHDLLRL